MKRIKLITSLALPVMALGGIAAPLLLTTSCASDKTWTFYNDGSPTLTPAAVGKFTCNHKDDYEGNKYFHIDQTYTFILGKCHDVVDISVYNDPYVLSQNGYHINWTEPDSEPADWATNWIEFDHTSSEMRITFLQKCFISISIGSHDGHGDVAYKRKGGAVQYTTFAAMAMRAE